MLSAYRLCWLGGTFKDVSWQAFLDRHFSWHGTWCCVWYAGVNIDVAIQQKEKEK